MKREDLQPDAAVRGLPTDGTATVVGAQWHGADALTVTFRDPSGRVAEEILFPEDEPRLEVVEGGRPWSFDGDGGLFRLVSEAHRIRLAHLCDPVPVAHADLKRCLIVCPGGLADQWQDGLYRRFHLPFEIVTNDKLAGHGNVRCRRHRGSR